MRKQNSLPIWAKNTFSKYHCDRLDYLGEIDKLKEKESNLNHNPIFLEEKTLFSIFEKENKSKKMFLSECEEIGCQVRRSDFENINGGRASFEEKVLSLFSRNTIKYASFASGYLHQDALILENVATSKKFLPEEIHAIDPIYEKVNCFFNKKGFDYIHKNTQDVLNKTLKFSLLTTYDIYDKETPYMLIEKPLGKDFKELTKNTL